MKILMTLTALIATQVVLATNASANGGSSSDRKVTEVIVEQAAPLKSGPLDGNTYCRTYMSDGLFGQPPGERQHCLEFAGGMMTDSANTAFGRPPEFFDYSVTGDTVMTGKGEYELSKDQKTLTSKKGASTVPGTVFNLQ